MNNFRFSSRSWDRLQGVDPRLVGIASLAITLSEVDFTVLEGMRSAERQKELVAAGASHRLDSYHLTGHAVDLGAWVGHQVRWDWPLYDKIAIAMKDAAIRLGIPLVWGGDWETFKDGPHFQIKR